MGKLNLGLLCTAATFAAFASSAPANATDYIVGLGAGAAPDYEGSDDYKGVPTWLFSAKDLYNPDTYVTLAGPTLRSNFVADPHLRAGLSGSYIAKRDDVEDDAVDRMRSVDASLFLGGIFGWDFLVQPSADLAVLLDLRYDVVSDNGYLITPRLSYFNRLPDSRFSFGAELVSNWASDDYMSEYFGVSAGDAARSGLNTYDADAGFKDVGIAANVNYRITEHWSTTLLGGVTRLIGDAADSPVVEDRGEENQLFLGFTVNYRL